MNLVGTTRFWAGFAVLLGLALLGGCAQSFSTVKPVVPTVHGQVRGGQQPVSGATIQLYAAGTTGDGSIAIPLIGSTVTTDANGNFDITNAYTCPPPNNGLNGDVYLVATDGNPGLGSGTNNTAIALAVALGPCANLTASTNIVINELTTVAAVWSLAPYMTSYSAVGSAADAGDLGTLSNEFFLASEFVNPSTGTAPGVTMQAGDTVPVAELNTIADILAACVNTAGGVVGDGSACGTLFLNTTPSGGTAPANTVAAALNMVNYPTSNAATLYGLVTSSSPFQPTLGGVPANFMVSLGASPTLTFSPVTLGFPITAVGVASSALTIDVTTTSVSPVYVYDGIETIGKNASEFSIASTTTCVVNVSSSAPCSISITFTPQGVGSRIAYLLIGSSTPNSPMVIPLTGIGTIPTTITETVEISNIGTTPLTISSISLTGTDAADYTITADTCVLNQAMVGSCEVTLTFSPVGTGTRSASLQVVSNAPGSPNVLMLSGTGDP